MPTERTSVRPSSSQTQLIAAVLVALGIGTGGGSILAHGPSPEEMERVYATKLEVAALSTELALVRQELEQATEILNGMTAQLQVVEDAVREPHER